MSIGFSLDEARGTGSVLPDHVTLPTIGRVAPLAGLLSMQQVRQHLAVMYICRRGRDRMNQLGPAVYSNMGLHAEVPPVALLRPMHLGILFLCAILHQTGRTDDGGIHDGPAAHLEALLRQILSNSRKESLA